MDGLLAYDKAQVCLNGHTVNSELGSYPGRTENFCSRCGAKTITTCVNCQKPIRGASRYSYEPEYKRPAFCPDCGLPYPWTEAALKAAEDLASELDLPEIEVTALKAALPDLVRDSPQTTVAASRFRRLIAKAGPLAEDSFKTILVNVVTEAAGRILFPS